MANLAGSRALKQVGSDDLILAKIVAIFASNKFHYNILLMMSTLLLLASVPMVPAGQDFTCTPVRVWDGDGPVWCAEGPHVRLAGIAAREMDGTCRSNQPCPDADATEARDALVRLLGVATGRRLEGHMLVSGPAMQCHSVGGAGGTRTAAWCVSPVSGDISCAMLRGGWALKWEVYWKDHDCGRWTR
jgi:endonuclease YncB( thermonuclease family)